MKNIWECEVCGKKFYDKEKCLKHEGEHAEKEAKMLEFENNKKESLKNLTNIYKEYLKALEEHEEKYGRVCIYSTIDSLLNPFSDVGLNRGHRNGWYL